MKNLLIFVISLILVSCSTSPYHLPNHNSVQSTVYSLDVVTRPARYNSYKVYYIRLFVLTSGVVRTAEIDHYTYNLLKENDTINIIYSKSDYNTSESHILYRTSIAGTIDNYHCFYNPNFDETYKIHKDSLNNHPTFIIY